MDVWFSVQAYDVAGSDWTLSLIGSVLENAATDGAPGLRIVEITAWFASDVPPRRALESIHADFQRQLADLPRTRYSAKTQTLSIDYRTSLASARPLGTLDYARFRAVFDELLTVFESLLPKLARKKGLRVDDIVRWLQTARAQAPSSDEAFARFAQSEEEREEAERSTKSEWELLGIEWDNFHPHARDLLDDPFFWEGDNDYAPNGNDTGSDLLDVVRTLRSAPKDPARFLDSIMASWGMDEIVDVAFRRPFENLTSNDEIGITTYDEAAIALPFALIKLYGSASRPAIQLALEAIERDRKLAERRWNVSPECAAAVEKVEAKLRELAMR